MKTRKTIIGYRKAILSVATIILWGMLTTSCQPINKQSESSETDTTESGICQRNKVNLTDSATYKMLLPKDEKDTLMVVPKMPEFPGGVKALMEYLQKNQKYPIEAQKRGIQGRVIIMFVVGKDGSILNPRIVRGIDPEIDKEALRIIQSMPKWIPGEAEDGSKAYVRYTIPISFKLVKPETDAHSVNRITDEEEKEAMRLAYEREEKYRNKIDKNVVPYKYPQYPQYPGGQKAMLKYINEKVSDLHAKYKWDDQDVVFVSIIVDKDGSITHSEVVHSKTSRFDDLAIEVVQSMPKWIPAEAKDGTKIASTFTIPIMFKLQ